jgi:hypothetical protein
MNGMDHARFEELKDAYVLGALPDEERGSSRSTSRSTLSGRPR